MRTLLYIPVAMLLAAGLAGAVCLALHWNGYLREMIFAAVICTIGAEAALMPAVCVRRANHLTISQAGLAGTVIELFLTLVLAALVCLLELVPHRQQFMFWILGFYWTALIVLVCALAQLLREAKTSTDAVKTSQSS